MACRKCAWGGRAIGDGSLEGRGGASGDSKGVLVAGGGTTVGEGGGGDAGWEVIAGGGVDAGWEADAACFWGVNIPVMSSRSSASRSLM